MTSVARPSERDFRRQSARSQLAVGYTKYVVTRLGALVLMVLYIPILLFLSALGMLVVFWPVFLGARLEYGFSPGTRVTESGSLWPEWHLLQLAWVAVILIGPIAAYRFRGAIGTPVRLPRIPSSPRPRV